MAIFSIQPVKVGQVGVQPNVYKMITDSSVSATEAAGFLQQGQGGNFYVNNDQIDAICLYGLNGQVNAQFTVSVNANTGVITLNAASLPGLGTAATKAASNNSLSTVASTSGSVTSGTVAVFTDSSGTLGNNPAAFKAIKVALPGGSATQTIGDANATSTSIVVGNLTTPANNVSVLKITPGVGNVVVVFSGDPGLSEFMYMMTQPN